MLGTLLALSLLACDATGAPRPPEATLLLHHGKVFTADPERPWAEGIAIAGERIVAVGADRELEAYRGAGTEVVDLGGRVVVPGFNDAHVHTAAMQPRLDLALPPDSPPEELLRSVARVASRATDGTWLEGTIGGAVFDDPALRRDALERASDGRPVLLAGWTGHGRLLSTAALVALGLGDDRTAGFGGWIERDARGRPTGLFQGYEGFRIAAARAREPDDQAVSSFRAFAEEAIGYGITSVQQMAMPYSVERSLAVLERAQLPLRWRVIDFPLEGPDDLAPRVASTAPAVTVSGVKWILDGTPEERWMARREPYADRPAETGRLYLAPDQVRAAVAATLARGEQPLLHAVGSRAIELALSTLEALAPPERWRELRPRIEHGDELAPDLRARAAALGVVMVQNPAHFTITDLFDRRLGAATPARAAIQPLRSLAAAGIPIALGSDGPLDPFLNLLFAVTHPANPGEALSVEEAVTAYTAGSAFAEHREHEKGSLRAGLYADLAVLSQDIFAIEPGALPGTVSLLTVIGGRVVHRAGPWAPAAPAP